MEGSINNINSILYHSDPTDILNLFKHNVTFYSQRAITYRQQSTRKMNQNNFRYPPNTVPSNSNESTVH